MVHISEALIGLLVRDGMTAMTLAGVEADGMKSAGVSYRSDDPQVRLAQGGFDQPMGTNMMKWRIVRARPLMMIADGGVL